MRAGFPILLLTALAVVAGCGDRLRLKSTRLSFDQFVNATVELRRAAAESDNPAEFQVRKRQIQDRLHFSDADLREFARAHVKDTNVMSAAWDSIELRLDRPPTPSKAAPPSAATPGRQPSGPREEITPGALPGGGAAVVRYDSMTPPADDTVHSPPLPNPRAAVKKPKPFY